MSLLLTSIATEVAGEFGSRLSAILASQRGSAEDARSRAIAIAVYKEVSPVPLTLTDLGRVFERDRTTVRHALERVEGFRAETGFPKRYKAVVERVKTR
jgi:chromosomal replication initiation ATPase DnaA